MSTDTAYTPTACFHNLIRRVKESGELEGVRFIKAMGEQPAERPISGYLAVCEIIKAEYENIFYVNAQNDAHGMKHRLKCGIKLMGKKHSSAYDLQIKLNELLEALIKQDSEGYVVKTEFQYAKYDKDSLAIFQQLYVYLEVYGIYQEEAER